MSSKLVDFLKKNYIPTTVFVLAVAAMMYYYFTYMYVNKQNKKIEGFEVKDTVERMLEDVHPKSECGCYKELEQEDEMLKVAPFDGSETEKASVEGMFEPQTSVDSPTETMPM